MNYIGYYRVSTKQQGESGLSLESQRKGVRSFVEALGGSLVNEYKEVASGGRVDREELLKAIKMAQETNATIVVKRIDRLSRDGFRISTMMEDLGIDYIDCDSPNDTDLVKNIKLAVAKEEKEKIRKRVQDGLDEAKKQIEENGFYITRSGRKITKLGGDPSNLGGKEALKRSAETRRRKALNNPNNKRAAAIINMMINDGKSWHQITDFLNEGGFLTSRGNKFSRLQVKKLHKMFQDS
jgi:DNA invertase Pin-like site-specific DNA recombinase